MFAKAALADRTGWPFLVEPAIFINVSVNSKRRIAELFLGESLRTTLQDVVTEAISDSRIVFEM